MVITHPHSDAPPDVRQGLTLRRAAVAGLVWVLGAAIFYRRPLFSGFRWMTGDVGDWRLNVFLLEHWRLVFEGRAPWSWRNPPIFFPATDTLALHDPDFGLALIFAPLRWAGFDPYLSFQLAIIAASLVGFLAFVAVAMRLASAPFAIALFGAFGFVFSNQNYIKLGHPNYAPVTVVALLALLYVRAFQALPSRFARANLEAAAGAALFGVLAMSCFQIAWYAGLLAIAAAIVLAFTSRDALTRSLVALGPRRLAGFVAIQAAALVAALVPMAIVFGPSWASGDARPYYAVLAYAGRAQDFVNVGGWNLLWGWLTVATSGPGAALGTDTEHALAQTPLVAVAFIALVVWMWRTRRDRQGDLRAAIILAVGVAALVLAPFAFKIGTFSGWWLLRQIVPGATAIRTPYRFQLVLAFANWMVIVAGAAMLRQAMTRSTAAIAAASLLGTVMLVEQLNLANDGHTIDRPAELARADRVAPPPAECRAFFARSVEPARGRFAIQTDAMLVAVRHRIPTLNGISGGTPADWDLLSVYDARYRERVAAWARHNGLTSGLCMLTLPDGTWTPWSPT